MIKVRNVDTEPQPATAQQSFTSTGPIPEPAPQPQPRSDNSDDLLSEVQRQVILAKSFGADVVVTGLWAWAQFTEKPAPDVLAQLKANRWIWCRGKGKWAYRGVLSHSRHSMSWEYITTKYGIKVIQDESKQLQGVY